MNKAKKRILLSIIATIMLVITISGVAYAFISAHYVNQWNDTFWKAIQAGFYPCYPTDGTYSTRWYGFIRQCYVRLIEKRDDGYVKQDTGRKYNYGTAQNKDDCNHYKTPYTKLYDTVWPIWEDFTTYSYWGWYYF